MSFSKYLDSKRSEIKQLVAELKKSFLYVSVLGVDIKATSFRVDKNTSNIDPGNDVECGFLQIFVINPPILQSSPLFIECTF